MPMNKYRLGPLGPSETGLAGVLTPANCDLARPHPSGRGAGVTTAHQSKVLEQYGAKDKAYCVLGLGLTGLSCARFLTKHQIPFFILDDREKPTHQSQLIAECPNAKLICGAFDETWLDQTHTIICSPGLAFDLPFLKAAKARDIAVISDIDLFCEHAKGKLITITGTNGKSTVTKMIYEMALADGKQAAIGGNYGIPALDCLFDDATDDTVYVLELSSFQLEITHALCNHVACFLNIAPDHLDRYSTFSDYILAKQRIYLKSDAQIYNGSDPHTFPEKCFLPNCKNPLTFDTQPSNDPLLTFYLNHNENQLAIFYQDSVFLSRKEFPLHGSHNLLNACAALAAGKAAGFSLSSMKSALKRFSSLPFRCELAAVDSRGIT